MGLAVSNYYGNGVINVKDGKRQKLSAAYAGGRAKNVFLSK